MNKNKQIRKESAVIRQAEAAKRTPAERLANLDAKLGVGCGATKERAKIAKLLASK